MVTSGPKQTASSACEGPQAEPSYNTVGPTFGHLYHVLHHTPVHDHMPGARRRSTSKSKAWPSGSVALFGTAVQYNAALLLTLHQFTYPSHAPFLITLPKDDKLFFG